MTGALAQVLAQAMAAWSLVAHAARWPDVSIWVLAPLAAAMLVPFRHDGTLRNRATGNFGAAVIVAGLLWWEVLLDGLDGILGGAGLGLGTVALLMLVSTVLFTVAGAMFWVAREGEAS
jgi:hypothetical protein